MAITIKDIARIAGVGVSTVSRAINDDPTINEKTRERVLAICEEYHYVPNNSARNLKMTESNTVALLVMGIENIFFTSMFGAFQKALEAKGYDFFLHAISETSDAVDVAMELTTEKRLKGIIFLGGQMDHSMEKLKKMNVPYVLCTVAREGERFHADLPTVSIDDKAASKTIVEYLIKNGHKKIAIIAGNKADLAVGERRLSGYRHALEDNGLYYDESYVFRMREDIPGYTPENGYAVAKDILASNLDFSALYCTSDLVAMGAYKAINEAGLRIPEDISVVGFDGINLGNFLNPPLTTMVQPKEELIKASVEKLLKAMDGEDVSQDIYEAELLERQSVSRAYKIVTERKSKWKTELKQL